MVSDPGRFTEDMKRIDFKMIFIRVFAVPAILILWFAGNLYAQDNAAAVLDGIQKKYSHLAGCRISYTREVITRSMSMLGNRLKGETATGEIFFAPPCLIRLEQKTPRRETVVGNEKTIWWYVPEESCVYIYPSDRFGKELSLLSDIFSGLVDVNKKFKVVMLPEDKKGRYRMELRPAPPWKEIDRIILTVNKDYGIRTVEIYNLFGGITRFNLKKMVVKHDFVDGFFHFVVPVGVKKIYR